MVSLTRHVALVGLPGAGKTRVGRMLAERLACRFADSDEEVERETGMTVSAIFARDGESRFRVLEREVIARLLRSSPQVIAPGGGAVEDSSTRAALIGEAFVIWLDVPVAVLVERLAGDVSRPLLAGQDLGARLSELSARRRPYYAQAHLRIAAPTSAEMVAKIVAALDQSDIAATSARR